MKIGFIGFGHMAGAIAKGLTRAGFTHAEDIYACASDFEKLKARAGAFNAVETASEVGSQSDIVIIAVKPNQVKDVLGPIAGELIGKIVVSVAFGLDFDGLEEIIPGSKHISIIPNTPCEVCKGITIIEDRHNLDENELGTTESMLLALGGIAYFHTDKMWLAGELTSCGPAFAAMFIEALGDAGSKYGIKKDDAYRIVSYMVQGTAALQLETGKLPGKMAEEVATPGGVTIKGVTALRDADFHQVVAKAIDAVENR